MSNGGPTYTREQWARDVLHGLGNNNPTQEQVNFLVGWSKSEAGGGPGNWPGQYNPINTSEPMPGSTCMNCDIGYSVQNYQSYQQGLAAILKNLLGGRYNAIVAYLRGQGYNAQQINQQMNMFICGSYDCGGYHYSRYSPANLAAQGAGYGGDVLPGYRPPTKTYPPPMKYTIPPHVSRGTYFGPPQLPPSQQSQSIMHRVQGYTTTHAPSQSPLHRTSAFTTRTPPRLPVQQHRIFPNYVQKNIPSLTHKPLVKNATHGTSPSHSQSGGKIGGPGHASKPKGKAR